MALVLVSSPRVGRRPTSTFWDPEKNIYLRRCTICKEIKLLSDYPPMKTDKRYGKSYYCRPCFQERARSNHVKKQYKLKKYGIGPVEYKMMRDSQKECCAICKERFTETPHVDHDHATGKVRSILCRRCNHTIGHARDDISILASAIEYLRGHQC